VIYLGLDTGPEHCGLVALRDDGSMFFSTEYKPWQLYGFLENLDKGKITITIERFQLYPWAAKTRVFSSFPECEIIGVVKYICSRKGYRCIEVNASNHKAFKYQTLLKNPHLIDAYSIARWGLRVATHPAVSNRARVNRGRGPSG
jgi:hypothetical protein